MFIADEPPLVSCTSQRSDSPSFQARSTAASGASENDATAMPWTSLASSAGVLQRRHHRVAHEMQRGLARLRAPRVGRLADADDGGVFEHALSSLPPSMLAFTPPVTKNSSRRVRHEIRNPRWNEDRLGCPDRDGRRRRAARRRVPAGRRRQISGDPELRPLRQGPGDAGGLQEPVAADRQSRARGARRLQQQVPELGAVRPREMGAGRLRLRARRFARRRAARRAISKRGRRARRRTSRPASTGPACSPGRTARSACTASRITR